MTPEHDKYFDGDEPRHNFCAITEHTLRPMVFYPERHFTDSMKLFRVQGEYGWLPEVTVADICEGDTLLIVDACEKSLTVLRLMHVTRIDHGEFFFGLVNDFLCFAGQDLIDRFAGLLGRVPTE